MSTTSLEGRTAVTRNQKPENPAIGVTVRPAGQKQAPGEHLWAFAKYPGFHRHTRKNAAPLPFDIVYCWRKRVKSYVSEVTILDRQGREVRKASIKVNGPLTHLGYTIYQSSYEYDRDGQLFTGLQVAKDPGVPAVYAGFALLLAGVAFIIYVKPYLRRAHRSKPSSRLSKSTAA